MTHRRFMLKRMLELPTECHFVFLKPFRFLYTEQKILQNKRKNANTFGKVQIDIKIPKKL